jgi:hypothetical protein
LLPWFEWLIAKSQTSGDGRIAIGQTVTVPARHWTVVTRAVPTSPTVNTFVRALDSDRYQLIEKKDHKEVYRDKQTGEKWVVEIHRQKD